MWSGVQECFVLIQVVFIFLEFKKKYTVVHKKKKKVAHTVNSMLQIERKMHVMVKHWRYGNTDSENFETEESEDDKRTHTGPDPAEQ